LERYLFYFNRYANHKQSIQLEDKLKVVVQQKMEAIQDTAAMSWIEVQFLSKALVTLRECRMVLM
jgi:ariadne-1